MRTIGAFKAYNFRTKDPAIDELRTLIQDVSGGRVTRKALKVIEDEGGPKVGTTSNWFFGDVKRPQSAGLEAAGRSMGYMRRWVKMNGKAKPWKGPK